MAPRVSLYVRVVCEQTGSTPLIFPQVVACWSPRDADIHGQAAVWVAVNSVGSLLHADALRRITSDALEDVEAARIEDRGGQHVERLSARTHHVPRPDENPRKSSS